METIFSDLFSRKVWTCFLLFMIHQGIFAERGGFLYFRFICFRNPGHQSLDGRPCDSLPSPKCDLIFRICISSHPIPDSFTQQHCPIHFKEIWGYDNEEYVCNKPNDNRKSLAQTVSKELPYPLQQTFYIKIDVRDDDSYTGPTDVASFQHSLVQRPSPNLSALDFVSIKMPRSEGRYRNTLASMTIEVALQCDKDRYGEFCMDFCKSASYDNYICSDFGKKICKEGWKGENCDKPDLCLFLACSPGAACIEINGQAQCFCNGQIGPQCNLDYNPCAKNPCQNQGRCIPNNISEVELRCQCNFPFYGSNCERKFDICLVEPCHNNATCVSQNNSRRCNCLEGFAGKLCDQISINPNQTTNNTGKYSFFKKQKSVIILSILFGASLILCIGIIAIHCQKKRNKKRYRLEKNNVKITMSDLDNKLNPPIISSQCDEKKQVESVYDIVDDHNTYAYIKENNDFYLIPSRPGSPGFANSPTVTSTIYLDMSYNNENCTEQTDTDVNRDSLNLPPLPSRDVKRKMSLKPFCLS